MKFIGYNGEIEFTDYFIRIRKDEKSASRIFYPLVIDTITLVKPTLTKVGYIYVHTSRGKPPSEIDCKSEPNAVCFKAQQYEEACLFKEELDRFVKPYQNASITHTYSFAKRTASTSITNDNPLPEVPTDIWNEVNSLYLFCLGIFDEWEIKQLEIVVSGSEYNKELSKEDYFLLQMHSMLRSHFGRIKDNTPCVLEYTGAEIELSAPEILLMQWVCGKEVNKAFNPPQYFSYNYYLDINEVLSRLYSAGYITYSDIEYGVKKLKVDDLKAILKKYCIKISGKKADLVEAVIKNVPAEALADLDKKYFIATNKGSKCIEENKYLKIFQWSHTIRVSPNEAFEYKKLHPDASAYDIGNAFLDKRINADIEKSVEDTVLLRMAIYGKADLCRLTEHYYEAAKHFIAVSYLDFLEDIRRRVNSRPLLGVEVPSDMKYLINDKLKMPFNEFDKLFVETIVELVEFLDKYHFKFYGHDIGDFQQELVKQIYN